MLSYLFLRHRTAKPNCLMPPLPDKNVELFTSKPRVSAQVGTPRYSVEVHNVEPFGLFFVSLHELHLQFASKNTFGNAEKPLSFVASVLGLKYKPSPSATVPIDFNLAPEIEFPPR